jgi:Ca-activated chloride channel homolog
MDRAAAMTYLIPELLWSTAFMPLLVAAYIALLRRRRKAVVRYSHLALVQQAAGVMPGWRRHVPAALILLSCAVMMLAAARPTASVTLPTQRPTVILALDVSGSMEAADVTPNRMHAAKEASKKFISGLPRHVRVGIVAYSDMARLVQPPTIRRDDAIAAIGRLQVDGGTAIGDGIATSLSALFPTEKFDLFDADNGDYIASRRERRGKALHDTESAKPVPPGSYHAAAIVLLSDGQNTIGPDPIEAAQMAAGRGVKIFTVGFGTQEGALVGPDEVRVNVKLDEDALRRVAEITRAEYFCAANGVELGRVYEGLQGRLELERSETEVTALFTALAALLVALGAGLSLWRFGRLA